MNRDHGIVFFYFLFTFDAFILLFSQILSYTIVANYLIYIIRKEKIYFDNETSVIRLI